VYLNGAILGLSQKELRNRFDEIVDFAGIGQFIDEPVKNYSSGMYVRLGFSVAINVDPDVLFVDEVLAVGDEAFQRKCNEKFAELKHAGKTIVLVSHGMVGVQNLCDRVAWFSHGQLMQLGKPREVIEAYTGTVQIDRAIDDEGRARWGSGEGRITNVGFVDQNGERVTTIRTGEPAILRLEYQMDSAIEKPVFGITVSTLEGFQVTGPNSREVGCVPEKLVGKGEVDIAFDPLTLLPGSYDLTVSLTDYNCMHPYDVRQNVLRFDVGRGPTPESSGVVSLGGRWRVGDVKGG
jgi:ABC-2 type transport system ATP-binding protein